MISLCNARTKYKTSIEKTWRHTQGNIGNTPAQMLELVRYATLAPSSHNTQCWKFGVGKERISVLPDFERRCPVADPDDHHLFVSLGCAVENLIQAAAALGFRGEVSVGTGAGDSLDIILKKSKPVTSPLFQAIPVRQSTRGEFDGSVLSPEELKLLEAAGRGQGVRVQFLTDRQVMENVLDFVIQGNTSQVRNPAFVRELKRWIRFNESHAARTGDGLFSGVTGNPSVPVWLGRMMFDFFFTEKVENDKYAKHVRSSAGIAVFITENDDKASWIEVGRAFERFSLQAAALGVRSAHLNQPIEVSSLRPKFSEFMGLTSERPDLIIRFGRGPEMPRSLRRPIKAVLL